MMGGGRGLQQRQGRAEIRRAGFALEIHVGQIGLGGGKPRLRGAQEKLFRLLGVFLHALALAQHHAEIAHGGDVLVAQLPPDLERLVIIAGVIGGDAGIEDGRDLRAGACESGPNARLDSKEPAWSRPAVCAFGA